MLYAQDNATGNSPNSSNSYYPEGQSETPPQPSLFGIDICNVALRINKSAYS